MRRITSALVPLLLLCADCGGGETSGPAATTSAGTSTSHGSGGGGAGGGGGQGGAMPDPTLTPEEQSLVDMPADTWMSVPHGYLEVCDSPEQSEWHAVSGCGGLFAWSGGAFDHDNREMLLWGGGHADYAGNEVYAFSTRTFTWARLTEPSSGPYDQDPLADGKPVSRHTYDGLTWVGGASPGVMLAWGGARSLSGAATDVTWTFEPNAKVWTQLMPSLTPPGAYDSSLVYDAGSGQAFLKVTEMFYAFDVATKQYTEVADLGYPPLWPRYAGGNNRGTIDTNRRLLWVVGGGMYMIYDIDAAQFVTDNWVTTGGGAFTNADAVDGHPEQVITTGGGDVISQPAPGLDYDTKADQMVGWVGGAPYVLDLATKSWTRKAADGAPAAPSSTGTFGRFRYIPRYNVFILVNDGDATYFYKNSAGGP